MSFEHQSVLVEEVIAALSPRSGGLYCDGTAGGGGHLARILAVPGTRAIGIDRDPAALAAARVKAPGARLVHARYSELASVLEGTQADGILLDLGV